MKNRLIILLMLLGQTMAWAQFKKQEILVLIHSENGGTYRLAQEIAKGVALVDGMKAVIKQVPSIKGKPLLKNVVVATIDELPNYAGIAFGSPVHFGNMSPEMRLFLDGSISLWANRQLEGIPSTVFMSAGSGAGNELAIQSFWNTLAVHGMLIVPTGIMGTETMDKSIAQGNTVLGTTSLTSMPGSERPSESEKVFSQKQGKALAKVAKALLGDRELPMIINETQKELVVESNLKKLGIVLPEVPSPAGNYKPYTRSGNLIFINQVALKDGKILYPGMIGKDVTEEQAKKAVEQTMLNVLAVLKEASGGNLDNVKQCVQLTGFFITKEGYTQHAGLMNVASDLAVSVFGEKGKHARATVGAFSLPVNSVVEIQAVFEVD